MANSNPLDGAQDIKDLIVSYAKQETIVPLRSLQRYLAYGLAGSLFVFLGAFFLGLGVLRLMQSIEFFAGGSWASTLPYVIALGVLVLLLGLVYNALRRSTKALAGRGRG
ncbi:MAG: hypothetical protein OEY41_06120 [Acidimicrobiia bacterium]|nr:hypothetical protein [Acidimicrobiia bacterium]MDH4364265.1 hypothetical protein [Acidimicrobiia bacterium]MDH5289556.1 hypothetical protein [Acidimicrobiia bacterium]